VGKLRRRGFLAAAGTGAFLTACSPARRSSPTAPAAGASLDESSLPPQHGGTFQTAGFRTLEHLNPWKVVNPNGAFYFRGTYDTLITYDYKPFTDFRETYKLVGALAETWEQPDTSTYVFHLRHGVLWHDGTPFTAADVKWSFEYMADPGNKIAAGDYVKGVASMTAPDDLTLQVKMKQPQVAFLYSMLGSPLVFILPRHVFDRGDQFEKVAVGTGPFKVDSYDQQKGISFVANKQYWKQGQPYLDRFKLLAPTDEAGRLAGFTAGQNDVLHLTDRRQVDALLPLVKGARMWEFPREQTGDLYLKLDKPPFNDKRIRQAIQMGIDRREMLKTLHGGEGLIDPPGMNAVAKGWALPEAELDKLPGWRTPKEQDIQEAKQLLAQAGFGTGSLSFTLSHDQSLDYIGSDATVVAAQLRAIGVTVNLQPLEQGVYTRNLTSGDYQANLDARGTSSPQNGVWQTLFHSGGFLNKMPVNDPEVDRLIDAELQEFDEAKRKALCLDLERLLAREVYVVPLTADPGYLVLQPYLHGWTDILALNVNDADWGQTWFDQNAAPKGR